MNKRLPPSTFTRTTAYGVWKGHPVDITADTAEQASAFYRAMTGGKPKLRSFEVQPSKFVAWGQTAKLPWERKQPRAGKYDEAIKAIIHQGLSCEQMARVVGSHKATVQSAIVRLRLHEAWQAGREARHG